MCFTSSQFVVSLLIIGRDWTMQVQIGGASPDPPGVNFRFADHSCIKLSIQIENVPLHLVV